MKLCIKQRVFSWTDTYDVYDSYGEAKYYVRAKFFSLGHQITVYEKDTGREVGSVHQRLFTLLPTYDIRIGGMEMGSVKKKFTFFSENYLVDYRGWDVEGNFLGWDYQVLHGGRTVMSISKEWLTWGDTYTLTYDDPADEIPGLLLVIAIDAANCDHND